MIIYNQRCKNVIFLMEGVISCFHACLGATPLSLSCHN